MSGVDKILPLSAYDAVKIFFRSRRNYFLQISVDVGNITTKMCIDVRDIFLHTSSLLVIFLINMIHYFALGNILGKFSK